jgi:hypothetical protein
VGIKNVSGGDHSLRPDDSQRSTSVCESQGLDRTDEAATPQWKELSRAEVHTFKHNDMEE